MTDTPSQSKAQDDEVKEKCDDRKEGGDVREEEEGGDVAAASVGEGDDKGKEKKVDLLKVKVESESVALNVLIGFIGLAQRRGAFAVNESAKIFEAIKMFMPEQSS